MTYRGPAVRYGGTQASWDWIYANGGTTAHCPHIFNALQEVRRGMDLGRVLERTALTATIVWENGSKEVVEQFDREITLVRSHLTPR